MTLTEQITDYVHAAISGLYIQTSEPDEAERDILRHARERGWKVAVWDVAHGLRLTDAASGPTADSTAGDPLAALRALPALADRDGTALLLLHNFHKFLANPEVIQTTFSQLIAGKQQRTFLVVLSPVVAIPLELEKLFVVVEHALPDRAQLERIARELTSDSPDDLPQRRGPAARAGRRRRPDALRGRERLRPVVDPPQRPAARGRVGAEGGRAQEEQPADAAPGRRTLRFAGRPGQPQGLLQEGAAARPARAGAGNPAFRSTRSRKEFFREGAGQRGRPAHARPRRRRPVRLPGRGDGGQRPPGAESRRRHEPVRGLPRRGGEGASASAASATAASPPDCLPRC